jgi:hypothetical protein
MINRILPAAVDNQYRGHGIALYFFYLITLVTIVRSCIHIFAQDGGAQSIATIPLERYTQGAGETIIFVFGLWGIAQLMMGLLYLLVAVRYRSLISLMYLFVFLEWSSRLALSLFKTVETAGTAPAAVAQLVLVVAVPLLFGLSVWRPAANQP